MTTIGFIRHGVTAWNKEGRAQGSTDVPLDEEGIQMAERVANRMEYEEWDIIYTSPLIRAKRTAEIIAEKQSALPFYIDKRLGEIGGGIIEGTTEAERVAKWGLEWRKQDMGFEPEETIISRGMSFIEDIKEAHPGKRVLVVSHGGFIGRLLKILVPHGEFENDIGNTSVTVVELQDSKNLCHLFNCTKHLETREV
ncbi:histidine phosphatase family protein [Psychrobacillus lasiicapitis]|uniref:Histidine phosphatase family protein n=1 Tax=Psychrobacillus lasiicapitis TaxID=1636719 RepID=A0A544T519_9BACI|nr:histidine phosphatase family protein [Psychrobacillus lasiicapitis]TQR12552.1 histidine phosphatase family protein [Psychrobacillus lasiicapitis]GGA39066.1 putative phosphatase PhoE [Psychrobacillus lasiicapitis]